MREWLERGVKANGAPAPDTEPQRLPGLEVTRVRLAQGVTVTVGPVRAIDTIDTTQTRGLTLRLVGQIIFGRFRDTARPDAPVDEFAIHSSRCNDIRLKPGTLAELGEREK